MAMLISGSKSDCRDRSVEHCKRLDKVCAAKPVAASCDCGGMRKAALRGQVNLQKRYLFAAACYNLSQLLRKKFGCGTLKMALATTLTRLLHHGLLLRALLQQSVLRRSFNFSSLLRLPTDLILVLERL